MRFQWMMHVVWLQVVSGDWSNYCGAKGDRPFGRGIAETSRIARRTSGIEDKSSSDKGIDLKGPSVTQLIMSLRRKDAKEGYEMLEEPKSHTFGGNPSGLRICLNIWKLEVIGTFSLEKLVNHLLVRGTISFYNQKLQLLPAGESEMWNVSNAN